MWGLFAKRVWQRADDTQFAVPEFLLVVVITL